MPSQGDDRYNDYLAMAIYTNYTGRTKNRLIGSVFRKPPEIDIPTQLDYMMDDCTGTGLGLEQFAKVLTDDVFITGRGCVLVDYPEAEGTESREQVITQNLVPRLAVYKAEAVYNWQSDWIDGKEFLTQVRIEEMIEEKKTSLQSILFVNIEFLICLKVNTDSGFMTTNISFKKSYFLKREMSH